MATIYSNPVEKSNKKEREREREGIDGIPFVFLPKRRTILKREKKNLPFFFLDFNECFRLVLCPYSPEFFFFLPFTVFRKFELDYNKGIRVPIPNW